MAFLKSARSVETVTEVGYHRCDRGLYLQVICSMARGRSQGKQAHRVH